MDLGTIRKKLTQKEYKEPQAVLKDVQLVWQNAYKYNQKVMSPRRVAVYLSFVSHQNSDVYKQAQQLSKEFETMVRAAIQSKKCM